MRAFTRQNVVASIAVVAVCGMILFALGHVSRITGTRKSAGSPMNCRVESSFMGFIPLGTNEFPGLKKARLGASRGGKNNTLSYSTWVEFEGGERSLISISGGSEESHRELIQKLNAAVENKELLRFVLDYGPHPLFNLALTIVLFLRLLFVLWRIPAIRGAFKTDAA